MMGTMNLEIVAGPRGMTKPRIIGALLNSTGKHYLR